MRVPEHAILANLLFPYNSAKDFHVYGGEGFWFLVFILTIFWSSLGVSRWHSGKESVRKCRRHGFNPWIGKIPWGRKSNSAPTKESAFGFIDFQYFLIFSFLSVRKLQPASYLENSIDWGTWLATVHGITESDMTKQLNMYAPSFIKLVGNCFLFSRRDCIEIILFLFRMFGKVC